MSTSLVEVPFHDTTITAAKLGAEPLIALRPVCEAMGLDGEAQRKRLARTPWATTSVMEAVAGDGKTREMTMIDRRTFTMWLATIDTRRLKNEATRERVEMFQREAADALDRYFNEGGAIHPAASVDQLDALREQIVDLADRRLAMLARAKGLVAADWLEQKVRLVVARGLGEAAEVDLDDRQLVVEEFLRSKGMKPAVIKAARSVSGKRIAAEYEAMNGHAPAKAPSDVGGRIVSVNFYVERDRPVFDQVWQAYYAGSELDPDTNELPLGA